MLSELINTKAIEAVHILGKVMVLAGDTKSKKKLDLTPFRKPLLDLMIILTELVKMTATDISNLHEHRIKEESGLPLQEKDHLKALILTNLVEMTRPELIAFEKKVREITESKGINAQGSQKKAKLTLINSE